MTSVVVDTGNVKATDNNAFVGGNYSLQQSVTCAALDNCLVVLETNQNASAFTSTGTIAPTYNGISLSLLAGSLAQNGNTGFMQTSIWYLFNPPTGSAHNLNVIYSGTGIQLAGVFIVPLSGVDVSGVPFGTPALNNNSANNAPNVTGLGANSAGLYLATAINSIATMTLAGANQNQLTAYLNGDGGGANESHAGDYILGANAGAFSWTGSGTAAGTGWAAVAVAVNSPPVLTAASYPLESNEYY